MDKKLLHKTQRVYLIYAIIIFIAVAPVFYFVLHKMYISNADESLSLRKFDFLKNNISSLKEKDIPVWNKYNPDIKILKDIGLKKDSLFYTSYYEQQDEEDEPYRELNAPILIENKPYTFSARTNLLELEDLITGIAIFFFIIFILLLTGLFFINKRLSLFLWKPFYQTLRQIEGFEIDRSNKPVFFDSDIEEFNRLNSSINKLIEKNIIIYNKQREFIENAAHELQTPIAVFKAKIDTLIQRPDLTKGQSEILVLLNNTVSRLNRLNKNLLLLSKIDKSQFDKTEIFSVKELIEKQLIFFKEQAEQKNIEIQTDLQNDFTLNANIGLTEILINNLLLNAIRHNVKNGEVNISLLKQKLIITNTGALEELDKKKLFSRFSKSNTSKQGNGLGLAIVKSIADVNHWTVTYSFSNNLHSFIVQF